MASQLDNEERLDEVPSFLPPYEGKCVLELGDGIGCFTGELAKKAGKVIAINSIENVVNKNKSINGHFMCADVNSPDLNFKAESMDFIFSNWLSMGLSDIKIKDIAQKLLRWTKVGGYILFRDPRFQQAGDDKQKSNTQDVHGPRFYIKVFKECHLSDAYGNSFEFSLVGSKCIGAYELNKKNHNQIWWIWKKVNSKDDMGCQQFLDNVMYKSSAILFYERIVGPGFMSIEGIDATKKFVAMLDLKAGQKVLDVGCGIGGSAFYMADNFDVDVVGVDLSVNMVSFSIERAIGHKSSVEFEVADCTKKSYPDNMFDVIYSRDAIVHIQDKPALFRAFYKWLKPGGKVLITDLLFGGKARTPSPDVVKLIKQLRYDLHDVEDYYQMFKDAGFQELTIEDRTKQSKDEFQRHLERLEKEKEEFVGDFSEEEYNDFISGWKENFTRIGSGEQKYCMIFATKK